MTRRKPAKHGRRSIVWSERARAELRAIGDFIAQDKPLAAQQWVAKLIATVERAAELPLAGRVVPEFGRSEIRETLLGRYRIVYRVRGKTMEVVTVFEGHKLPPGHLAEFQNSE